jgi:hypothetical protein
MRFIGSGFRLELRGICYITPGDDLTPRGAAIGAWMGGLLSVLTGAAFLWVPGFGPLLVIELLDTLILRGCPETSI